MYKFSSLFLLLMLLVLLCFSCSETGNNMDVGRPVITGSPVLVLNP